MVFCYYSIFPNHHRTARRLVQTKKMTTVIIKSHTRGPTVKDKALRVLHEDRFSDNEYN
jgi:hypothetical protein